MTIASTTQQGDFVKPVGSTIIDQVAKQRMLLMLVHLAIVLDMVLLCRMLIAKGYFYFDAHVAIISMWCQRRLLN